MRHGKRSAPILALLIAGAMLAGCGETPPAYKSPTGFKPIVTRVASDGEIGVVHAEKREKSHVVFVSKTGRTFSEWIAQCELGLLMPVRSWDEGKPLPPVAKNLDWRKLARGTDETTFAHEACKAMDLADLFRWRDVMPEPAAGAR